MAKPVIISADSTVDLSKELIDRFQIQIVPLTIVLGEETFLDGEGFAPTDIYARYRKDKTLPHTAAPGEQDFYEAFEKHTREGFEVVHIDISSELSGTYNAATLAARRLEGVYTVDSRMLSTGGGLLAIEAAECRDRGMSAAEIAEHITNLTDKVSTSFVLDTLTYMIVATEGPEDKGSKGLKIPEFAQLVYDLGAKQAYNLDGGSSVCVCMNYKKINTRRTAVERAVTDAICFVTLVPD